MKRFLLVGVLLMGVCAGASAQRTVYRNAFRCGVGFGSYTDKNVEGTGLVLSMGWVRQLKNERLRLNPYWSTGGYGAKKLADAREQWFTSNNLGCNLWYDAVDETGFAITTGAGLLYNHMNGLLGDVKEVPASGVQSSEYVSANYVAGYLGAGIRIKNYNGRFTVELLPLNLHFGPMDYLDLYSTVGLNYAF